MILSACNMAASLRHAGRGWPFGLSVCILQRRRPSLLVSYWLVGDGVAAELTVKTLLHTQAGESRATALQNAMQNIRNAPSPMFANPSAWAPFTIAGERRRGAKLGLASITAKSAPAEFSTLH